MTLAVVLIISAVFFAFNAHAASFDCAGASGTIDRIICGQPWLAKMDDEMADYYSKLHKKLDEKESDLLFEEQKQWIKERDLECGKASDPKPCLHNSYLYRIESLRSRYDAFFLPKNDVINKICSELAALDSRSRRNFDSGGNTADINNDGVDEIAETCNGGTMHTPCIEYMRSDGERLQIDTIGYEWKDYWTYGLMTFELDGRVYRFHSYDDYFVRPAYLSYVTPDNHEYVVCEFENKEVDVFTASSGIVYSEKLCGLVRDGNTTEISTVQLPTSALVSRGELEGMDRYETGMERLGELDYDNDGHANIIGELEYASGAGRGCDFNYFDEINPDAKAFRESPGRDLLLRMQKVDLKGRHPNCGGMNNRFFIYKRKNYYEYNTDKEHAVWIIENQDIHPVCMVERIYETSVKSVGVLNK